MAGGWIIEIDIRKYFDSIDHERLREMLRGRIRDGAILRLIGKWGRGGSVCAGRCAKTRARVSTCLRSARWLDECSSFNGEGETSRT